MFASPAMRWVLAVIALLAVGCTRGQRDGAGSAGDAGSAGVSGSAAASGSPALSPLALPLRNVRFVVQPPSGSPAGEVVRAVVTGVNFFDTLRAVPLERQPDGTYAGTVPVEDGALVQYHYDHAADEGQFAWDVSELALPDIEIEHRVLFVDQALTDVHDTIAMWRDRPADVPVGRVTGHVVDAESGEPVADVDVGVAGMHTASGYDGSFSLESVPAGAQRATAHHAEGRVLPAAVAFDLEAGGEAAVELRVRRARTVPVTFEVALPDDTPPDAEIRLSGTVRALGTWHYRAPDQAEGLVMPALERTAPGRASITLDLYEGMPVGYRYHLGIWGVNDERTEHGRTPWRSFIPRAGETVRVDRIEGWHEEGQHLVTVRAHVPASTPEGVPVQFSMGPSHWMTRTGDHEWSAFLFGRPGNGFTFRFLLGDGSLELGRDATPGLDDSQRSIVVGDADAVVDFDVAAWSGVPPAAPIAAGANSRVTFRVSIPYESAGRAVWVVGDGLPGGAVAMTPQSGNASLLTAQAELPAGSYVYGYALDDPTNRAPEEYRLEVRLDVQTTSDWIAGWTDTPPEPARQVRWLGGTFTPDLFAPSYPRLTASTNDRIAAHAGALVAVSSVWSYGRIRPLPTLEPRPIFAGAVLTPRAEAIAQSARAHERGLRVMLVPQFNMEMTPDRDELCCERDAAWVDAWLGLAAQSWLYHADLAQEMNAELLLLPGPTFHVFEPAGFFESPALFERYDDAITALVGRVRERFHGQLLMSGSVREMTAPDAVDFVGTTTYDIGRPDLPVTATVEQWRAAYAERFRERVDPLFERWGKPVIVYQLGVSSRAAPGDPFGEAEQAKILEAIYREIAARPWIAGAQSWAYAMWDAPASLSDGVRARIGEAVQAKWYARFAAASAAR